jgi:hypothetical protein
MPAEQAWQVPPRRDLLNRAKSQAVNGELALRQVATNQLLHRINTVDSTAFTVKGGTALHARNITDRFTKDIDMRGGSADLGLAMQKMREALLVDLHDGLEFQLDREPTTLTGQDTGGYQGLRMSIDCIQSGRVFATVKLDLVTGPPPFGEPEASSAPLQVKIPELTPATVTLYPIEDHIADKVAATLASYRHNTDSTRVRDLHDLCALAGAAAPNGGVLTEVLEFERLRRRLGEITAFAAPEAWRLRWPSLVAKDPHSAVPVDFDDAVAVVKRMIDPILTGDVRAETWDPQAQRWR